MLINPLRPCTRGAERVYTNTKNPLNTDNRHNRYTRSNENDLPDLLRSRERIQMR